MSLCIPFQVLNQLTDIYEILFGRFTVTAHPKTVLFIFLLSVTYERTSEVGATLASLNLGLENIAQ